MTPSILTTLRLFAGIPVLLLVACTVPGSGPPPAAIDNVRSVEIQYQYSGWSRADEVHRLQRSGGQRAFTRTSKVETAEGVETTQASVPAQRVGELVWVLSAPPWPRERGMQVMARRVRPLGMLESAAPGASRNVPACTAENIRNRMFDLMKGSALRAQLDTYYTQMEWTDDYPMMRVVIRFRDAPDQVISSRSQKLQMLPWTLGDLPEVDVPSTPRSWSVPVSDALRRLLPPASLAAKRLGEENALMLGEQIRHAAQQACESELEPPRAAS
jgi:hypothetical protein